MSAMTNDQVKETLADLAPETKRFLGCEELRERVIMLLEAEIMGEDYAAHLKHDEKMETMTFEDKVSSPSCSRDCQILLRQWCSLFRCVC
jgi:hypothetical protein